MYSAPPQYHYGSTSGLLPGSSIPMQAYSYPTQGQGQTQHEHEQQQQQSPYIHNSHNSFSTEPAPKHDPPSPTPTPPPPPHDDDDDDAPPRTHYPRLTFKSVLLRFLPILVANVVLEALFVYILKYYGDKKILMYNDRRLFNMASLLLAAALSMGIGYLLGEVGMTFRGSMMGKSDNTKAEIAHILRGSLGSYALLAYSHVRRKAYTHATTLSWLFVLGNLLGRLSVGLIGLTYAVEEDSVVTVPALVGTWWPEVGAPLRNESIFMQPLLVGDTLVELLRETTKVVAFPGRVGIELDDRGEGVVRDLQGFLGVPGVEMVVEDAGNRGGVRYVYVLRDSGGDPAIRVDRTITAAAECTRETFRDVRGKKYSSSTFYPTGLAGVFGDTEGTAVTGWILYSDPQNAKDCGASCVTFGVAEGSTFDTDSLTDRWGPSGVGYTCQLTITYTTPLPWGLPAHVAPSPSLLHTLSSFLLGNGTHHDLGSPNSTLPFTPPLRAANAAWLAPWGDIDLRTRLYPQGAGMAGVFARAAALVVVRLGNGLDRREIEGSRTTIAGVLSVDWRWVVAVFVGICVVQVVVAVVAGGLVLGSLGVEDDLGLLDGLVARERFPGRGEGGRVQGKPWVKTEEKGGLSYRFKGGAWGKLDEGVLAQAGVKGN